MWGSENNLGESVLSFHSVDLGDLTQAVRLGSKSLNLSHCTSPTNDCESLVFPFNTHIYIHIIFDYISQTLINRIFLIIC